ncbi:hypothetical protein M0805_001285 [Coniferiporia weirii]|nr:hypothetical protein M0805_001285 [Coniferiporia weirii]
MDTAAATSTAVPPSTPEDDEDSFLYGDSIQPIPPPPVQKTPADAEIIPVPAETPEKQTNGVVAHLEAEAENELEAEADSEELVENPEGDGEPEDTEEDGEEGEEEEAEEDEESDDDVEFILEPQARSLDFRAQRGGHRPGQTRTSSAAPQGTPVPSANLTTEYTPRERGPPAADIPLRSTPQASLPLSETHAQQTPSVPAVDSFSTAAQSTPAEQTAADDGFDPSVLPPARAPPSHPVIEPDVPGMFDGRSIFEIDMTNLADKPWRRPGSDLSDWFNYGFDEISWEVYCYRRRSLGDMAGILKASVLGFAGMPEEQLLALPPDARTMVMTGTNAMISAGGGPNGGPGVGVGVGPGMMTPVNMNPMGAMNPMMAAEMSGMGGMGPMGVGMGGPMGMGMNGNMGVGMPGPGPGPMMQDGPPGGPVQVIGQGPNAAGPSGTPEQGGQMALPDGLPVGMGPGMMGMNMGNDFGGMQDGGGMPGQQMGPQMGQPMGPQMGQQMAPQMGQQMGPQMGQQIGQPMGQQMGPQMGQQMFPGMESAPAPSPSPVAPRSVVTPTQFRGRGGMAVPRGGRAVPPTFPARGRGRGGAFDGSSLPVRPASPLPPNVPTGPRNPGNRYKDRDNNAPAVEGLDYGGNKESGSTPSVERGVEQEEKPSNRKRRSPPSNEEDRMGRSAKRR